MPKIRVEEVAREPWEFSVRVGEGDAAEHIVTVSEEEFELYGGDLEPLELVKATFAFLLAQEDAEDIADHFSLTDIEKDFPEYPEVVEDYSE